VYTDVTCIA